MIYSTTNIQPLESTIQWFLELSDIARCSICQSIDEEIFPVPVVWHGQALAPTEEALNGSIPTAEHRPKGKREVPSRFRVRSKAGMKLIINEPDSSPPFSSSDFFEQLHGSVQDVFVPGMVSNNTESLQGRETRRMDK